MQHAPVIYLLPRLERLLVSHEEVKEKAAKRFQQTQIDISSYSIFRFSRCSCDSVYFSDQERIHWSLSRNTQWVHICLRSWTQGSKWRRDSRQTMTQITFICSLKPHRHITAHIHNSNKNKQKIYTFLFHWLKRIDSVTTVKNLNYIVI